MTGRQDTTFDEPGYVPTAGEWQAHRAFYRLTVAQRDAAWREIEELRLRLPGARDGSRSDERTQVVETEEHPDPGPGAEYETTASGSEDGTGARARSLALGIVEVLVADSATPYEPDDADGKLLRSAALGLLDAADRIELLEGIVGWVLAGYDLEPVEIEYLDDPSDFVVPFEDVLAELADALPKSLSRADALALRARQVEP